MRQVGGEYLGWPTIVYMSSGVFRGKESSNRIKLCQLVEDIEFWWFGLPMALGGESGWMWVWGGGRVSPTHVHMHAHVHTCLHTHIHVTHNNFNYKWQPPWGNPWEFPMMPYTCMHVCMHVHVDMYVGHPHHPIHPSPHLQGDPQNQ